MKLTARQERFIAEYLIDLNATQAAIRAGYSKKTSNEQAARLLTKVSVQNAIQSAMDQRSKRTEIDQDYVLNNLKELLDTCMGRKPVKVMTIIKNPREGTAEPVEVEGVVFEPASANKTLELIGRHLKMFTDKVDMTSNGQTLQSGVLVVPAEVSPEEWEKK